MTEKISFVDTHFFSKLIDDYVNKHPFLMKFVAYEPDLKSFEKAIEDRQKFPVNRTLLASVIGRQYKETTLVNELEETDPVSLHISSLHDNNTFTVTTGHQLNILTGPLYFIYKLLSTVKLTHALKEKYPAFNFIPIYWMASEDHDFAEIQSVSIDGKISKWETQQKGATGRFTLENFNEVLDHAINSMYKEKSTDEIKNLLQTAYLKNKTLAHAMRSLVHALFGNYGVVVLDASDHELKKTMIPLFINELTNQIARKSFETLDKFESTYGLQVHARNINLFYLYENSRERIEAVENGFRVLNTNLFFSHKEMEKEVQNFPERISPNVVLRPLYQESILPNLAYIGGPAEVHYWLQLKSLFTKTAVFFPVILLRNCILWLTKNAQNVLHKTEVEVKELFLHDDDLIRNYIEKKFSSEIDLQAQQASMRLVFTEIMNQATLIDQSLLKHVGAEQARFEKRLLATRAKMKRALKRREHVQLSRLISLKKMLFPNGGLQERNENIFTFLSFYGLGFTDVILQQMEPIPNHFLIIKDDSPKT
jgi:bacillithiol biosynthesis cysteine-adding enzyme BshC